MVSVYERLENSQFKTCVIEKPHIFLPVKNVIEGLLFCYVCHLKCVKDEWTSYTSTFELFVYI